ncbi:MAG TPA: cysteine dioxygenase family protein [Oscillatoriaceae cyanobacterium]
MTPLTWQEFLDAATSLSDEALTEDALYALAERLVVDASLLAPYIQFEQASYARHPLYRDARFEALCLCWEPGQGTAIHNHGDSFGIVYVYEGALTTSTYRRQDDGTLPGRARLAPLGRARVSAGGLLLDRQGAIHAIANPPGSGRRAVSLHFYAGPLATMEIFDLHQGTVAAKAMQGEPLAYIEPGADVMAALI